MNCLSGVKRNRESSRIKMRKFTAWMMMGSIAFFATLLVGVGVERPSRFPRMLAILPLIISIAFFLIADVESPRLGMISVVPDNLRELSGTLQFP